MTKFDSVGIKKYNKILKNEWIASSWYIFQINERLKKYFICRFNIIIFT